jgi:hypothetical protein
MCMHVHLKRRRKKELKARNLIPADERMPIRPSVWMGYMKSFVRLLHIRTCHAAARNASFQVHGNEIVEWRTNT